MFNLSYLIPNIKYIFQKISLKGIINLVYWVFLIDRSLYILKLIYFFIQLINYILRIFHGQNYETIL